MAGYGQSGFPDSNDFQSRRVTNPNQSEVIRQRYYDYQLYATAGYTQLNFFSQPIGSGLTSAPGAVAGTTKTRHDTNLEIANSLPSGKGVMIESLEVIFLPGSVSTANTYTAVALTTFAAAAAATVGNSITDIYTIYQSGLLELQILDKVMLSETPLLAFPPKAQFDGFAAIASNSATVGASASTFLKAAGRPYYLQPEVALRSGENFSVSVKWPGVVATPSGFNGRIGVILDGFVQRAT